MGSLAAPWRRSGLVTLATLAIIVSACSGSTTPAPAASAAAASPGGLPAASGTTTLGSNESDANPKAAVAAIADYCSKQAGITITINTTDHNTFQNQISSYLQGKPDDVVKWFAGNRLRFFASQGLLTPIDDVWAQIGANYTDAFKTAATGADGHQYLVPSINYPWVVMYRKSLWTKMGYTVPATITDFVTLAKKMQTDGLVPLAYGDKDGWPAMGHFDIINLRENGYQYHVDLMAGKQKWTDPKTAQVFTVWKDLLPYYQTGAAGRIWQDASAGLVAKTTGMMLQPQVAETFTAAEKTTPGTLADLDFFPWPGHGKGFDAEAALDAPIDGYMLTSKSPNAAADAAAAKTFLSFLGTGAAQIIYATSNVSGIATASDVDTSAYTALQKKQVQIIAGAKKFTQFMDRDTKPEFAGANGMQGFLIDFLANPNQDLTAFLAKIQSFWDSLG